MLSINVKRIHQFSEPELVVVQNFDIILVDHKLIDIILVDHKLITLKKCACHNFIHVQARSYKEIEKV